MCIQISAYNCVQWRESKLGACLHSLFFDPETPVNFYRNKLRHISEDSILQDIFIL
jgi:hypothetical protein